MSFTLHILLPHSHANILILILFALPFTCSAHFLIHCVNIGILLISLPPSSFFSSSPPLLICVLNYSILPGLLILLIEPITFWLDQCGEGNDLNGCRIKPHNHFNWCRRGKGGRGGRAHGGGGLSKGRWFN